MAKQVQLTTGRSFSSIDEGVKHFTALLDNTPLKVELTGADFEDVKAVYRAYCDATHWPLPSPPVAFYPMHEAGKGYTTRCFGVKFEDATSDRFSIRKALSKIAK